MPARYSARATSKPTIEKRRTCSGCGRLGHLVSTCENPERFHNMIGIEIEGWWFDLISAQEKARQITGAVGVRDGSLMEISTCNGSEDDEDDDDSNSDPDTEDCEEGCDDCPHPIERRTAPRCDKRNANCRACGARSWEFRTKPGSVGEALRQLTTLYPDVTSKSAGMHVHMSFKEKTSISMLCSDAFFKYWQERWELWGTKNNIKGVFWERLRNQNQYCRPVSIADYNGKTTVDQNAGGRYKAINFQAYTQHETVEFRMLPMFQKGNLGVLAVEQLVDIVESFLQNAELHADIIPDAVKVSANPADPVIMEPVALDFEVPTPEFPEILGEVELDDTFKLGEVLDAEGNPTGAVRMFRWQVAEYLANTSTAVAGASAKIADPKRNKVVWSDFNSLPRGTVR